MSRVKKQILGKLKEYANKMGRDHLGGDDIPGNKKKGGLRDNDGYDNVQYNRDMPQDEARDPNLYYVLYRKIGKSGNPASAGYESKKDAEKFAKSLSKTHTTMVLPKQMVEGMELANEQGVGTATVFLKNQEELDEGGLPQNWMAGRTSDYHTKLRGKKRNYDDTNFAKMNTGQPDIEDEELDPDNEVVNEKFNKVEHLSLLNKALKAMPGSQNQKEIIRQLNVVRKAGGMRPLKETAIEEYGQRLDLSYILDDESVLDGTPEEKDAINRESAQSKTKKNYKDWKNTNESVNEDKVYIDFLNKKKGFKQDRIKFSSYKAAVKWAKKNFEKFNHDMIKYESVTESLKDMVGDTYTFSIGSGDEKWIKPNTKEYVIEKIAETIKHNLYDWDFSLNGIDGSQAKEYSKIFDNDVLKPLLRNIDKTLKTYFKIDSKNKKISWKLSFRDNDKIIDAFFKKNKKISSDIRDSYFSQNEAVINEKQFKGLDGIDDKTPLTKISDTQKLKIIQSTGNIISFKVPKGSDRNFWQVISKGKIKKQKDLSNNVVYILPGKMIGSPKFKSIKDLIKGVDWVSVEKARRFNESVSEVAERDYKDEYKKFQSSTKSKKYRAELNKYNRDKGTYGNGDGKDASHKGGKIVGFESEKKNRGRAEKSRLKKK
jgi:hypothetical protein